MNLVRQQTVPAASTIKNLALLRRLQTTFSCIACNTSGIADSMATMQNKRKRESQDMGAMRAPPAMNQPSNDFDPGYLQPDDDGMDGSLEFIVQHGTDQIDTGDLQHETNHKQPQRGDAGAGNASDTAAAAMAQYHTMTVPQSTEQTFMTQPSEGGDRPGGSITAQDGSNVPNRTASFGEFDATGNEGSPNGDASPGAAGAGGNSSKPSVGSDEWHKIRKDNHKEGMLSYHPP